jgi:hypothetical protein
MNRSLRPVGVVLAMDGIGLEENTRTSELLSNYGEARDIQAALPNTGRYAFTEASGSTYPKRSRRGSNLQPSAPEADALSN